MTPDAGGLELAKRILRSKGLLLEGNEAMAIELEAALVTASDANPSIIIEIEYGGLDNSNQLSIAPFGGHGGIVGGNEPITEDIVWLHGDLKLQTENLFSSIVSLASAGYPGCIGCTDEGPWSESKWRAVSEN